MSLTIRLKNIGILKQAEFSLGDITLICGENNTGKTYTAYALYGFLRAWRDFTHFPIDEAEIQRFLAEGTVKIDVSQYVSTIDQLLSGPCAAYSLQLRTIFGAPEGQFQNSTFSVHPKTINVLNKAFSREIKHPHNGTFRYSMSKGSPELTITSVIEDEQIEQINPDLVKGIINLILNRTLFSDSLPYPFMASAERTGVSTFLKELNFARNALLEAMMHMEPNDDPHSLLLKSYQSYPLPVQDNVNFTGQFEDIAKAKSFIAREHPEILKDFADIIGGDYGITQNDQLYYSPKGTRLKLTMVESSSLVRALINVNFYLRHVAQKGDLLMIDEPELSLHPKNQRRIARLFARLANVGVKVFVTTHSDYIIKELNTLMMLNQDNPRLKKVAEANGYQESELITAEQVKVYVAEKALLPLETGQKRRRRGHTLTPAKIHPTYGIEVPSFDETIEDMNRIQDEIVWGET